MVMQSGLDSHIYFLHQLVRINALLIEYPCKGSLDVFSSQQVPQNGGWM